MMGKRQPTGTLFDVGNVFPYQPPKGSFHAQLAEAAPRLFTDVQFQALYHPTRGRFSVPPSELALLLLLQAHAGCSDAEAVERSACDLRWCAVLRKPAGEPLGVKSTLQLFRAQLVLQDRDCLLTASLKEARRSGLLGKGELRLFLDTKPILGWGAVKDTYNLLGDGLTHLITALARAQAQDVAVWAQAHDCERYLRDRDTSVKGAADLDWTQATERQRFLGTLVAEVLRLGGLARQWLVLPVAAEAPDATARHQEVERAVALLEQLLGQDLAYQVAPDGQVTAALTAGTSRDRVCATTDPEQRHGHKSKSKKFTGHKLRIAVVRRQRVKLVVNVEVLAGNAGDAAGALQQVKQVEETLGQPVAATWGDCAFGSGETRQEFVDAERVLYAKSPEVAGAAGRFRKTDFQVDLTAGTVTCPAGAVSRRYELLKDGAKVFVFGASCTECPLRSQCTAASSGRRVRVHPQEELLAAARALQATAAGKALLRERIAVEHALGLMARWGAGQARYRGRLKTGFQMQVTAAVVNLRQLWNWAAATGRPGAALSPAPVSGSPVGGGASLGAAGAPATSLGRRNFGWWWRVGGTPRHSWPTPCYTAVA